MENRCVAVRRTCGILLRIRQASKIDGTPARAYEVNQGLLRSCLESWCAPDLVLVERQLQEFAERHQLRLFPQCNAVGRLHNLERKGGREGGYQVIAKVRALPKVKPGGRARETSSGG